MTEYMLIIHRFYSLWLSDIGADDDELYRQSGLLLDRVPIPHQLSLFEWAVPLLGQLDQDSTDRHMLAALARQVSFRLESAELTPPEQEQYDSLCNDFMTNYPEMMPPT